MFKFLRRTSLYILAIPMLFILLATASNQLVLAVNHDTFPVRLNPVKLKEFTEGKNPLTGELIDTKTVLDDGTVMIDDTHCLMSDKTHLNLLADTIDFHSAIYSIGDEVLDLGEWLWAFAPFVWAFAAIRKLSE
jgi:hypothetical protein